MCQPEVTKLVNGGAVYRGHRSCRPAPPGRGTPSTPGDRSAGRVEILRAGVSVVDWYENTAQALTGTGRVPGRAGGRRHPCSLVEAVRRDLATAKKAAIATGVRMIWTAEHVDAVRHLQDDLRAPAEAAAHSSAHASWRNGRRSSL